MRVCRRGFAAALVGGALAACAPMMPPGSAENVQKPGAPTVAVREDLSGRFIALIGPKRQHAPPYLDTPGTNFYCLRSFIDRKTGKTSDQLYVAASYDAKRDWNAAHDEAGRPLKFIPISRNKILCAGNCSYAEEFAANLRKGELLDNPEGFAVTFVDRAGNAQTIVVSEDQVSAQLAAVATRLKELHSPAAPTETPVPQLSAAHQAE
jgi:hypothetical protein